MIPQKLPISRHDLHLKKMTSVAKTLRKLAPEIESLGKSMNIVAKVLGYQNLTDLQNSALPVLETNYTQAEIDLYIAKKTFKIAYFLNTNDNMRCLQIARQMKLYLFESLRVRSNERVEHSTDEQLDCSAPDQGPVIPIIIKKRKRLLLRP
ncbi:hypothetical protein ACIQAL_06485 [Pseudomonas sp. NPDC088368]|uniref:hypothetical protein n=1 Tax=Pseudomonas sp. NPDC088368 TaxID=3364453 RepID=UPI003819E615